MRTLISTAFISLDGVVEDPGGQSGYRNGGWTFKSVEYVPEAYAIKGSEEQESTALLMGRKSYELFSPVWPVMEDFAHYKGLPKYVVSSTLADDALVSDWGPTTILRSLDEVRALKESEGGPIIIHGSVTLNHALADADLIDRYNLSCSHSSWAQARSCSATPTRTPRSSSSWTARRSATASRRTSSTSSTDEEGAAP